MSTPEEFYDLLFEVSNEDRHKILRNLQGKTMRTTDLANETGLNNPEIRRHISRLMDTNLIQRNSEGYYRLTPYGEVTLSLFHEIEFISKNNEYLKTHVISGLPNQFLKQIGSLMESKIISNTMDFFRYTHNLLKDSENHVWMLVDQLPMTLLQDIVGAIDRGVSIRLLESSEQTLSPDKSALTSEESRALALTQITPLFEKRSIDHIPFQCFLSESNCVLCFPTQEAQYDYSGFLCHEPTSLGWCTTLFTFLWSHSIGRSLEAVPVQQNDKRVSKVKSSMEKIEIFGHERPEVDVQAVQDAVDNYKEVTLSGKFNFGSSTVIISKSVAIRGKGREEDLPSTKVYKSGWAYPILAVPIRWHNRVFYVDGEDIEVTIENIHFTDFEYNCICARNGNSLTIKDNRITLSSGLRRGMSSPVGNQVIGIFQIGGFPGGVRIADNYLDFAESYGPYERSLRINELADDPNFRPDLTETYSHVAFGIDIFYARGEVRIENNTIRNINSRAIVIADNTDSANIYVENNSIISEIYGAYFGSKPFAGYGIAANSGWHVGPAPHIEILGNTIRCDKINYCGIGVHGPELGPIGAEALTGARVNNNHIHLEDGSIGIYTESLDNSRINGNTLTGKAYYGIGILPGIDENRSEFGSFENVIENNDMRGLEIKAPDKYSKTLFDEKKYPHSKAGSSTAYVLLDMNTNANKVKVTSNENVLDEGTNNKIKFKE